ncbi:helix-turn-helix domain-containing protein [Rhodococcus hoagii]|nr:helix-turn-helix domain-containing protein [Prescottella equi]NKS56450.1 helix-turn-helix domain-containing protein [Prescottella equi]NKS64814.1 helix-turn-helix domain-containing protein [Prescottella equi]NKS70905.1 helix-turn-helix domain-containing protein [Prescottella equi]NKS71964.1 helix-turn-helix domain-containing protein [Prescottella equi]
MSRNVLRGFSPERFQAARQAAGMTRGDLARLADIRADETIRRWERGSSSPQVDVLGRAVKALNISAEDVIITDPERRFLSDWRHLKLMTQPQLAKEAQLSTILVTRLERGERELTDEVAAKLANVLGIGIGEVREAYLRAKTRDPGTLA